MLISGVGVVRGIRCCRQSQYSGRVAQAQYVAQVGRKPLRWLGAVLTSAPAGVGLRRLSDGCRELHSRKQVSLRMARAERLLRSLRRGAMTSAPEAKVQGWGPVSCPRRVTSPPRAPVLARNSSKSIRPWQLALPWSHYRVGHNTLRFVTHAIS